MSILDIAKKRQDKQLLFEYFVDSLYKWNKEIASDCLPVYTKLQLQKLLFLTSAANVNDTNHKMLDIFNRFYALPYGPVEMDIYNAMNMNSFQKIDVQDRNCTYKVSNDEYFSKIDPVKKTAIDESIKALRTKGKDYFAMSPFDLVNISHYWTVWKDSIAVATLCGSKQEPMSTEAIYNSEVKYFG